MSILGKKYYNIENQTALAQPTASGWMQIIQAFSWTSPILSIDKRFAYLDAFAPLIDDTVITWT